MRRLLIPCLLLLPTPGAAADLDVLFVGNSYTSANNLASTVEAMIEGQGEFPDTRTAAHAPGGWRFVDHIDEADGTNGATTLNQWITADADGWDVVVLQEQSQIPGFYDLSAEYDASFDAVGGLNGLAAAVPAETLFFMTWGRRDGDPTNAATFPDFLTMQDRLEVGYRRYADAAGTDERPAYIAPAGPAFRFVYEGVLADGGDPLAADSCFVRLYAGDGSHPSADGTWIAGAAITAMITGAVPVPSEGAGDCYDLYYESVQAAVDLEPGPVGDDDDASDDDDGVSNLGSPNASGATACGCNGGGSSSPALVWLLALGVIPARRRRRRGGAARPPFVRASNLTA